VPLRTYSLYTNISEPQLYVAGSRAWNNLTFQTSLPPVRHCTLSNNISSRTHLFSL